MKVGLIIYDSLETISGGNLFDRMLVSHLRENGDDVEIYSLQRRRQGMNVFDNLTFRPPAGLEILLQDELTHPSLILSNKRDHPYPVVSIVHHLRSSEARSTFENAIHRWLERQYLNSVNGFIFNSETTRASVEVLLRSCKPSIVGSPGGDRLGTLSPQDIQARARKKDPLRLVFLGNVIAGKGLDIVLDALMQLPQGRFTLDIVGSCEVEPQYAMRMRRKAEKIGSSVTFTGRLEDKQVSRRLKEAHVMVLPSYYEGFGIAFLEGMAHGLPAIGTMAGAMPDLISNGINGFLIPAGDSAALVEPLMRLAEDRSLLLNLSLSALTQFNSRPTWGQTTERIRSFLLSMVKKNGLCGDQSQARA